MDDLRAAAALEIGLDLRPTALQLVAELVEQSRPGVDGRVLRDIVAQACRVEKR